MRSPNISDIHRQIFFEFLLIIVCLISQENKTNISVDLDTFLKESLGEIDPLEYFTYHGSLTVKPYQNNYIYR